MRGKEEATRPKYGSVRITPAYAGKSCNVLETFSYSRDHPRLCGEKLSTYDRNVCRNGSPPPMRGKGPCHLRLILIIRITPAYAGKRMTQTNTQIKLKDHPRLCGEKLLNLLLIFKM